MTIKEALETLQKQYNCWTTVFLACPIQCEKCKNNVNFADFLEAVKTVLDAFGNCTEQKWIPCSEALPKDDEYVLLTIRRLNKAYNQLPFISTGYVSWNGMCWWCAHDGDCKSHDIDVMAWQPLPEPYRGNTE